MKTYEVRVTTSLGVIFYLFKAEHSIDATTAAHERYPDATRIVVRAVS